MLIFMVKFIDHRWIFGIQSVLTFRWHYIFTLHYFNFIIQSSKIRFLSYPPQLLSQHLKLIVQTSIIPNIIVSLVIIDTF